MVSESVVVNVAVLELLVVVSVGLAEKDRQNGISSRDDRRMDRYLTLPCLWKQSKPIDRGNSILHCLASFSFPTISYNLQIGMIVRVSKVSD